MLDEIGFMDIGLATWPSGTASTEAGSEDLSLSIYMHLYRHCREHAWAGICNVRLPVKVAE